MWERRGGQWGCPCHTQRQEVKVTPMAAAKPRTREHGGKGGGQGGGEGGGEDGEVRAERGEGGGEGGGEADGGRRSQGREAWTET